MEEVTRVKMAKFRHDLHSQIRQVMKKYIFILNALELMSKLYVGKRVEGVLYVDQNTGRLTFKAYQRQPRVRQKDELLKKTPWGWLKASVERVKRFSSLPKDLSLPEKLAILDEENELVKQALIESYIIESV